MKINFSLIAKLLAGAGVILILSGCNNNNEGGNDGTENQNQDPNEDMSDPGSNDEDNDHRGTMNDPDVDGTGSKNNGNSQTNTYDNERYTPGSDYGNENSSANHHGGYTAGSSGNNSEKTSAGGRTSGYEAGKGNSDNWKNSYNTQSTSPNERNKAFLKEATELNLEEIKLGDLAMKKGSTGEVRNLGEMMMTDHRTKLDELTQMSKRKNWKVPTDAGPLAQSKYDELNATSGHAFDKMYCELMVEGHKKAIARFERATKEITDKDLKSWANKTLPALRKHLEHSQSALKKTNAAMQ